MAAVTTHDLPTIAGLWTGSDIAEQRALGLEPNEAALAATRKRLASAMAPARGGGSVEDVVAGAHEALSAAPSLLVTATLDDALGVAERPNVPGTTHERPNWSLALPEPLERLETTPLARRIAGILAR
jgi:4-alpha-glucanotransferase